MSSEIYQFGGIDQIKKNLNADYFGRQIIEWNLECESQQGLDRKSIVDMMSYSTTQDDDKNNYYISTANVVCVVMIVILGCMCSCGVGFMACAGKDGDLGWSSYIPFGCLITLQVAGAFAVFGTLRWAVDYMDVKEKKLSSYNRLAACSTEYLAVQPQAYDDFEKAGSFIRTSSWLAITVVVLWACLCIGGCGFAFLKR